jgi:hypothetical protein
MLVEADRVLSPSSRPEIKRFVRGRRVEAVEWAELVRTLLLLIAVDDKSRLHYHWVHVG